MFNQNLLDLLGKVTKITPMQKLVHRVLSRPLSCHKNLREQMIDTLPVWQDKFRFFLLPKAEVHPSHPCHKDSGPESHHAGH